MRHLVRAVAQEYGKQGRLTLEADFEHFHELIRVPEWQEELKPTRPGERDEEEEQKAKQAEPVPEEERPLDSGTVQSLREADPRARAQAILQLQRLHGNAAVQRVINSLQVTDASREARVQMIGEKAEEAAPTGQIEKATLYREAIEAELDAAPLASKSERDLMTDNVNTIGQIFTNYQAALHQFEEAIGKGAGEAVPRELAKEVLREAARDVFEPVLAAAAETAGEVADHVADGIGVTDVHPAEKPRQPGASAPAYALQNLLVAERRRIAATQMRLLKAQISFAAAAGRPRRARRRRLPQAAARREHGPQRARGDLAQRRAASSRRSWTATRRRRRATGASGS